VKALLPLVCTLLVLYSSAEAGQSLIDQQAPTLEDLEWVHLGPLTLEELKGRVILIRWWTAPYCPFCKASAIALNDWFESYESEGLSVIGLYHTTKQPIR